MSLRALRVRRALLAAIGCALSAAPVGAQSLLDRPPNLSGGWTGMWGSLYFNFMHRFTSSDGTEKKVSNSPTFLVAAGLPGRGLVGFNYATNSQLAPRYPNEWETFARWAAFAQDENGPLDLAGQVGYNLAAEGVDGELSLARRQGPFRVIGAARVLSDPFESGKRRFAFGGGATVRLGTFLAFAGDIASLTDREDAERAAWSAGVHVAIPNTPHTLSLHASNVTVNTLQGLSRGGTGNRYGFEFTIPLTLRRFFPAKTPPVAAAGARTDSISRPPATPEEMRPTPVPILPARADTTPVPRVDSTPAAPVVRDTAPRQTAVAPAPTAPARAPTRATPTRPKATVRQSVIRNLKFVPRIEVEAGTTVEWKNSDPLPHTVTAPDKRFDSGLIGSGKTWRRTFNEKGTFHYQCLPHPFMTGIVVVK